MSEHKTLIVIPAYNEEAVIGDVVRELLESNWQPVVVDDCSSDQTSLRAFEAGATVLRHVLNRGQGAALQTGITYALRAGAENIVNFDADGQHDRHDIPKLIQALEDGADIALGSRFLGTIKGASRKRVLLLHAAQMVSNLISGLNLTDAHCGLRAFRASAAPALHLRQDRMAHASEILTLIRRNKLKWVEVPVTIKYTEHSMAKGQTGIQAIRILFDYFFRGR